MEAFGNRPGHKAGQIITCIDSYGSFKKGETYTCLRGTTPHDRSEFLNANGNITLVPEHKVKQLLADGFLQEKIQQS